MHQLGPGHGHLKMSRCSWAPMVCQFANAAGAAAVVVAVVAANVGKAGQAGQAGQAATAMVAPTRAAAMQATARLAAVLPALPMVAPNELGAAGRFGCAGAMSNLGALRVTQRDEARLELSSGRLAAWFGWTLCVAALGAAWWVFAISTLLAAGCGVFAAVAAMIATAERRLVFDRAAGVVMVSQRIFGISTNR